MDNEQLIADLNLEYQKQDKCRTNILLIIIIILSIISIIFIILYATKGRENEHKDSKYIPLSLWNNCDAKSKLMNYIGQITNKTNKNYYIPKEDRIAVFDLDGTLFQETDPTYNDWKVYLYRVFDDPEYKNKATSEEKELGERIKKAVETNTLFL